MISSESSPRSRSRTMWETCRRLTHTGPPMGSVSSFQQCPASETKSTWAHTERQSGSGTLCYSRMASGYCAPIRRPPFVRISQRTGRRNRHASLPVPGTLRCSRMASGYCALAHLRPVLQTSQCLAMPNRSLSRPDSTRVRGTSSTRRASPMAATLGRSFPWTKLTEVLSEACCLNSEYSYVYRISRRGR